MNKPISLFRGDSSDLVSVRPNLKEPTETISSDWICRTMLVDSSGVEIIASRIENVKSEDGLTFIISLSPADTLAITVGVDQKYTTVDWVVQLSNDQLVPAYSKEKRLKILVREQAIIA